MKPEWFIRIHPKDEKTTRSAGFPQESAAFILLGSDPLTPLDFLTGI